MKLTKHRLKEIIGQELEALDNPASELEDLIGLSGKAIKEAIAKIEGELPVSPERDAILSFIQNSGRGIMKGYMQN